MTRYCMILGAPAWSRRFCFARTLYKLFTPAAISLLILVSCMSCAPYEGKTITAFCGAASKPAMEEAARIFTEKTGIKVYLNFGGSGTVLSQMKIAKEGDLYIPGSQDFMVIAERERIVDSGSVEIIAYLIPSIVVHPGNPRNIRTLADLAKPGIKVGIGNPESVCLGLYAFEILESAGLLEAVGKNIVTYAESCEKAATLVALKSVDAIIGWDVFPAWNPGTMQAVPLKVEQLPRIAYVPVAISNFSKDKESANRFRNFLVSAEGKKIFGKWGYITTESEARKFAPGAAIGGEYKLPGNYRPLVK